MDRLLDKGLEKLTALVYKMGEVAEKVLSISLNGYIVGEDITESTRELSQILGQMTKEVEEKSFNLIAKYQPVATDLRIINSYMKIAYDFERCGRYSWDIAYINKTMGGLSECSSWMPEYIADMSGKVLNMVNISVRALKTLETDLAKSISESEQEVDKLYFQYLTKLVQQAQTTNICTVSSVLVIRYLERIADHATYVSEAVVYIATGEKIRL
ncbi:MAG: phosphate signaling complex protein PhoU [Crenarchaeota archaeon]|nr:phosphate signaling complex protein PhoU [Thermoproteota archaeon]